MINAVIIEDEQGAFNVLKSLLENYLPQVKVLARGENVKSGIEAIKKHKPDLLFLDIRLPDGDGFEILDETKGFDYEVIFTTAYGEYREKAFDNFALHYITKPIDIDQLEAAIRNYESRKANSFNHEKYELLKQMFSNNIKKIALPTGDGYALVEIDNIMRCEAQSNYTMIYLNDGKKYLTSKSLKHYDEMLSDFSFYRIHKSHLVNTNYIVEVKQDGTVIMSDDASLSISQRAKRGFMKFLEKLT